MGIWEWLFGDKGRASEEAPAEIVQDQLCIDKAKHQVRIKKGGREIFGWEFFQTALQTGDFSFGRFYLVNEKFHDNTHFAPSLEQAIQWFRGRAAPKDGYLTISWGETVTAQCQICKQTRKLPLKISKVERLVVYADLPQRMEIEGWRVVEVYSEVMGKGTPTKVIYLNKTNPIITWHLPKDKYLCDKCAQRLKELDRANELGQYAVFPLE